MPKAILLRRMVADYLVVWLGALVLAAGFAMFYMLATGQMDRNTGQAVAQVPWVRGIIRSLLGADLLDMWTPTGIASLLHTHPFVWALTAGLLMTLASGALAGEVDRGTADLLLTLPVSRSAIYWSRSLASMVMAACLAAALLAGQAIGRAAFGWTDVRMSDLARVSAHFVTAECFLLGFFLMVSSACSRRGTCLAISFVFLFYWFVVNFVAELWEPAMRVAFTSFLRYYRPLPIVRDGVWRWGDMAVLLAAGVACWLAGLLIWQRRDVPAR